MILAFSQYKVVHFIFLVFFPIPGVARGFLVLQSTLQLLLLCPDHVFVHSGILIYNGTKK